MLNSTPGLRRFARLTGVGGVPMSDPGFRLGIVADDLTGAADAAAAFAVAGFAAAVALRWPPPEDLDVLAMSTGARGCGSDHAELTARDVVEQLRGWGADRLFVKIDSVLRGPVRGHVRGAVAGWAAAPVVATPAFPAQGRTVLDGVLRVDGVPVVASTAEHFPPGVAVADAGSSAELAALAERIERESAVAVGTAGLAGALATRWAAPTGSGRAATGPAPTGRGVLVAVGSAHPVTATQVAVLRGAGVPVRTVPLGDGYAAARVRLAAGGCLVVTLPAAGGAVEPAEQCAGASRLAGEVAALLDGLAGGGLVVTGGDTALAVARALDVTAFFLDGQLAPGIPYGRWSTGPGRPDWPVVTKSGGFGPPSQLADAVKALGGALCAAVSH